MCGIAGLYHLETAKPVDPARVRAMLHPMAHRGPDGSGEWTAPGVGLGHLRLSIIDIAGSPQPMASDDEMVTLTYNGEIYNFRELRAELEDRGHRFRTSGDTEVIIAAWRQWGPDCLSRLNGMFAFAIHDHARGCLFLARDRLGVKPLHYVRLSDGSVAFASELKGLLRHPLLRREANLSAVEDYFAFGYVPDDTSIVAGVEKLPAGHFLLLERGKPVPEPVCWWAPDFSRRIRASESEAAEHLVHLMRAAVTDRMVADVPLGAFLSGGVDSSAVVALMAEASAKAVKTCTIGFDQAALDETAYARQIAERFATDHRTRTVAAADFALIDRIADSFDEPFADASALPTYRVCELAREEVTVALSGDGADEAFAGYRRLVFQHQEERLRAMIPAVLRRGLLGPLARVWPQMDWAPRPLRARATLASLAKSGAEGYAEAVGVTGPAQRARLFNDAARRALGEHVAEARYWKAMAEAPARERLDRAQYADLKIWLPGDILTKTDRMSMAVGLEAREPLLDYRLVEFAASLPAAMRVRGGTGKAILKQAMERYLPRDILYRPKMGFVTPVSQWFRGPLTDQARALATSSTLARSGWFDMAEIERIVAAHQSGRRDHGRLIWQYFMLEKSLARLFGI
ncbi:XrtA/PEP-CTERM system amidotransferase [Sphingopyxis panaciterrulae]|uniref:asparagine synthase (glutamine-hydrolyzing) n=1 Tax=Sphingopyxis panaciterrulae TaxID=462372 RepID=A0A7W9ER50_9SPHN|nr:XrtA/PEP-CTERM system amidotransferase [Sphingopyxis panaciterrulae]MBB5707189.1 asparagine synthase (glutamine-hydrolyzing) [Sphingopyxis panaciterrulae]